MVRSLHRSSRFVPVHLGFCLCSSLCQLPAQPFNELGERLKTARWAAADVFGSAAPGGIFKRVAIRP